MLESDALEQSNANAISSMAKLLNASRQLEMVIKVVEAASQTERRAARIVVDDAQNYAFSAEVGGAW